MAPKRKEEHAFTEYDIKVRRYESPGLCIENIRPDELAVSIIGERGELTASKSWPRQRQAATTLTSFLELTHDFLLEFLPLEVFGLDCDTTRFTASTVHHFCGQKITPIADVLEIFDVKPVQSLPACIHFAHGKRAGLFSLVTTAEQATKYLLANWPEDSDLKPVDGAAAKMKKETYVPLKESRSATWVAKKNHVGAWKIEKRPRPNVRIYTLHVEKKL